MRWSEPSCKAKKNLTTQTLAENTLRETYDIYLDAKYSLHL